MRLIDAEDVKELLKGLDSLPWEEEVDYIVDGLPTIEAEPVRHGRWLSCGFGKEIKCSVCGCELGDVWEHRYCPDCGAKMDKGEE